MGRPKKTVPQEVERDIEEAVITPEEVEETQKMIEKAVEELAPEPEEPKKKTSAGRATVTKKKLEALAKARAAKEQQLKKYKQEQKGTARKQAEEYFEKRLQEMVEERLKTALEKKKPSVKRSASEPKLTKKIAQ